jgi:NTE family protein
VNGLGRNPASCADLLSYLLFTPGYTRALIDIGYKDADKRIDEIEDFLLTGEETEEPAPVPRKRKGS